MTSVNITKAVTCLGLRVVSLKLPRLRSAGLRSHNSINWLWVVLFWPGLSVNAMQTAEVVPVPVAATSPEINAKAWALMEMNSGWIVSSKNANTKRSPASITKLMANYVLFSELQKGTISLQDRVPISEKAWRAEGSRMFADVSTKIELELLLKGMVIQSGNDASIALAEFVSGSEPSFAALMNKSARELGLRNSFFVNSTGLTAKNHEMTAVDILTLSAALIREFPEYYAWYSQKEFKHNGIVQRNRNRLLWKDSSVDGLKTGYTDAAGYCLVASAKRGEQRWIAVVLGTESSKAREKAVLSLLEFGFDNFESTTLLDEQGGLAALKVYGGNADELRLQVETPANIVVPSGRSGDVTRHLEHATFVEAPISAGAAVGTVRLMLDEREVYSAPLLAMSTIKQAGWWKGLIDSVKLRWRKFLDE